MGRTAAAISPSAWALLAVAALAGGAAWYVADPISSLILLSVAVTLVCLLALIQGLAHRERRAQAAADGRITEFIAHDASPSFTTDADGCVGTQNASAARRFGDCKGRTLVRALGDLFANPAAVLYRMQNRAQAKGAAREDVVTRQGHVRLSVHRIGAQQFLWRLEEMVDRSSGGRGAESLSLPMLTVCGFQKYGTAVPQIPGQPFH
jgi:two-component system, cell cycle sensor histidine kinase and response regulator CckA